MFHSHYKLEDFLRCTHVKKDVADNIEQIWYVLRVMRDENTLVLVIAACEIEVPLKYVISACHLSS